MKIFTKMSAVKTDQWEVESPPSNWVDMTEWERIHWLEDNAQWEGGADVIYADVPGLDLPKVKPEEWHG